MRRPLGVVGPWLLLSTAIGAGLLMLVWVVAELGVPDPERPHGLAFRPSELPSRDLWGVLQRNLVVLALHATACLAGYIVHSALRDTPAQPDRLERVTRATARVAIWWVPTATVLSIATQAWILGSFASTLAAHLHMSPGVLLATTLPHALPELAAVFLPLSAWLLAMRRRRLSELYAATLASVVIAVPILAGAAWLEVHTWHERVQAAPVELPDLDGVPIGTLASSDPEAPAIQLVLGERLGPPHRDETTALAAALERSADAGGAVAVVPLGTSRVLHEVRRHDADGACRRPSGDGSQLHLHELRGYGFVRRARSIPGTVVGLEVEAIADDGTVAHPALLVAPSHLRTLAQEACREDR